MNEFFNPPKNGRQLNLKGNGLPYLLLLIKNLQVYNFIYSDSAPKNGSVKPRYEPVKL